MIGSETPETWLTRIVTQYQSLLLKVCYAYLCDAEQAHDAVQETYFKAFRRQDTFRNDCSEKT